ncbi:organic cation transporter protein-like [Asterias amurensis]|uniref:organic cation transporter protein-like n=1 Tax=Asterias amurensis TaxID=7602 RepID=UPI003AB6D9C8
MDLDDVWVYLGDFGRYQTVAFILITLVGTWLSAWQTFGVIFTTDQPPFHCRASPGFTLEKSVPRMVDQNESFAECLMYAVEKGENDTSFINTSIQVECTNGYEFVSQYDENTIVMELDLVCKDNILLSTAQSILFFGVVTGAFVSGQLSDLIGRKTVLLTAVFLQAVAGIIIYFIYVYHWFVVLLFFIGMFEEAMCLTAFVLVMEMFSPKMRTIAGCINGIAWGVGVTLLAGIAYFIRDWRKMQLAISLPCLIAIPLWFILYESVRWLLSKGRNKESFKILNKIARVNNITPPADGFVLTLGDKTIRESAPNDVTSSSSASSPATPLLIGEKRKTYTVIDICRSRIVRKNLVIMSLSWFVNSMVYYGMSLYSTNLAGDKYLNFFLLSVVEIPGFSVTLFTMMWWGRRPSLVLFHLLAGFACILIACLPRDTGDGSGFAIPLIVPAMLGKFCITCSISVTFLYGAEIFPTPLRNIGFCIVSVCGRAGSILAPFIIYLEEYSSYLPLNIFGGLCLIAGVLVPLLPETRNKPLPETMEDAEKLGETQPIQSELSKWGVAEDVKPTNGIVNYALEDSDWFNK